MAAFLRTLDREGEVGGGRWTGKARWQVWRARGRPGLVPQVRDMTGVNAGGEGFWGRLKTWGSGVLARGVPERGRGQRAAD